MIKKSDSPHFKKETQRLFIGGREVNADNTSVFSNFSPSTGEKICDVQIAGEKDIESAVNAARIGFQTWSKMSGTQRGRILNKAAQLIRQNAEELAWTEVLDTGKPISEALSTDIPSAADALEYFAGLAATLHGHHVDLSPSFAYTRWEPLGICASIGAWNYPLQIACWKSAPALAGGNAMIYKPSDLTPLTTMKLAQIFTDAGLPDGVFNVVHGDAQTGELLCAHPAIRKVSLTGSVATGKKVMAQAAQTLKHVSLELGGKSPLILFADSPLEEAVSAAMVANFYTQGEVCSNGTRVFVEEKMLAAFLDQLLPRVSRIRVGDPFDPHTQMGALISRTHFEKVQAAIASGQHEGATLMTGGLAPKWPEELSHLQNGHFMTPAVFINCQDHMSLSREEIFGPVMSILTFKDEAEVIARANDTPYGLAAGVMTRDIQRAHRVVAQLEAGICWINNYNITPVEIPFGGTKLSGMGRENGLEAMKSYGQAKTVYVEMDKIHSPF